MHVTNLSGTIQLAGTLRLAHLSVVLFTSLWSLDSLAARSALDRVAGSLPSNIEPSAISFYEVPVTIDDVHPTIRTPTPLFQYRPHWRTSSDFSEIVARNATRDLPWFPCLRIFTLPSTGTRNYQSVIYTDSFTDPAISRFVLNAVRYVLENKRQSQKYGETELQSCNSGDQNDFSESTAYQKQSLFSFFSSEHRGDTSICRGLQSSRSCAVHGLSAVVSSMSANTCADLELSPDIFTSLLFNNTAGDHTRGLMLFVQGGAATVQTEFDSLCITLLDAVQYSMQRLADSWIACIIDTSRFAEYAQGHGALAASGFPTLALIDAHHDNIKVLESFPTSLEELLTAMKCFELAAPRSLSLSVGRQESVSVSATSRQLMNAGLQSGELEPELVHVVTAKSSVPVWLIAHQPWCGFSQRAVAVFREFVRIAGNAVRVYEISDVDRLPPELDGMIDGFPTVLHSSASTKTDHSSSGACEGEGAATRCSFVEYTGLIRLDDLLETIQTERGSQIA